MQEVASERGDARTVAELHEASESFRNRRFNVAVLGQFKRGKSTLVNALIGRELLPSDVAPITSAITIVEHGPRDRAVVQLEDGREEAIGIDQVGRFVSEETNPGNRMGVRLVRIELPSAVLESGLCLVDTPGVGSVFESNSRTTRDFLHRIDVAIFVLGGDPPISGEELRDVVAMARQTSSLCFAVNKADLIPKDAQRKIEAFTRRVLREALGEDPGPLIFTSALAALRTGNDPGVTSLAEMLRKLAANSRRDFAGASTVRAVLHAGARLQQQIDLERGALLAPLEETDRRIESFQLETRDFHSLAIAALTRAREALRFDRGLREERRARFIDETRDQLSRSLEIQLAQNQQTSRRTLRKSAIEITRHATAGSVGKWHEDARAEFERVSRDWKDAADQEMNRLLDRVAEAAARAFGIPVARFHPLSIETSLKPGELELIEDVLFLDPRTIFVPLLDLASSRNAVVRRAKRHAMRLANGWLDRNLNDVDQHLVVWMDTLARSLETSMTSRLEDLGRDVIEAVEAGRRRRDAGDASVRGQLEKLDSQRSRIESASA